MTVPPSSRVVGVLEHASSYQASLYQGVRTELEAHGVPLLLLACDPFRQNLSPTLHHVMRAYRPAAVIRVPMASPADEDALDETLAAYPDVRVVQVGRLVDGPCVQADNESGMRELVRHLIRDAGVRRPLVVRGVPHHEDSIRRERAVREEFAAHGLALDEDLVVTADFQEDLAHRAARALLTRRRDLDAVIGFNDDSALGAARAVVQAGLRIPQDVVVAGFDNGTRAEQSQPPLTSVDQRLTEQGASSARLVLRLLAGESVGPLLLPTRLVVRESSLRDGVRPPSDAEHDAALLSGLWHELGARDAALSVNRSLLATTTVEDTLAAVAKGLDRMSARRAFVALRDRATHASPGTGEHLRLALVRVESVAADGVAVEGVTVDGEAVDGVAADELTDAAFDGADLLPADLLPELYRGTLSLHPLSTPDVEFGYVLLELARDDHFVTEVLQFDMTRALDRLRRAAELTAYASNLERVVAERTAELEAEVGERRAAEAELQRLNADLRSRLHEDGLTGICNRVGFDVELLQQWQVLSRLPAPLSLLMLDVDHFKTYNDAHGHLAGDECLKAVARCLAGSVNRPHDTPARYGGEEFAVILPNTPAAGAQVIAHRIQQALDALAVPHPDSPFGHVTVSVGVATVVPGPLPDPAGLIAAADGALYAAKAAGRNACVVSEDGVLTG